MQLWSSNHDQALICQKVGTTAILRKFLLHRNIFRIITDPIWELTWKDGTINNYTAARLVVALKIGNVSTS